MSTKMHHKVRRAVSRAAPKQTIALADQRLLRHPPTENTWVCLQTRQVRAQIVRDDGVEVETLVDTKCNTIISGRLENCFRCGNPMRRNKFRKLYPEYLAACERAGHNPGERWPPKGKDGT